MHGCACTHTHTHTHTNTHTHTHTHTCLPVSIPIKLVNTKLNKIQSSLNVFSDVCLM